MKAFSILNLPISATKAEVKARWRQLAKQYHPDAGGDMESFIRYNEAYKTALAQAKDHAVCEKCEGSGVIKKRKGLHVLNMRCPECKGKTYK